MANSILGGIAQEVTQAQVLAALGQLLRFDQLPQTPFGALQVGAGGSRFRDDFVSLDTLASWDYTPQVAGMTASILGNAGGASYLSIDSGTLNGSTWGIVSKQAFSMPLRLSAGLSMSQRIAGTAFFVELVGIAASGEIDILAMPFSAPNLLDAKNGVGMKFSGASTSNGYYVIRAQGGSEMLSGAVSYGTTHMAASGTTPNFFPTYQFEILLRHDLVAIAARAVNSTAAATVVVTRTDLVPDPDLRYALRIRAVNESAPASATQCRVHFVRVMDAAALPVDFGLIGGNSMDSQAAPVKVIGTAGVSGTVAISAPVLYADTSTPLAASAGYSGTSRDGGATATYRTFAASFLSDVAGTAFIELSTDNTTFRVAARADIAGYIGQTLEVPVTARYYRVRYVNGANAQTTFQITSAFHRV